jgi:hypothetical protein
MVGSFFWAAVRARSTTTLPRAAPVRKTRREPGTPARLCRGLDIETSGAAD